MNSGIIVAAGKGERMGVNVDKAFLSLGPKPVLVYSLQAFEKCLDIEEVVLVVRKERVESARMAVQMFGCTKVKAIIAGGQTRQASVMLGIEALSLEAKIVAIQDGARPNVTTDLISETIKSARLYGSGVAAVKITDTVKEVEKGLTIASTIDRTKLWRVQTPQTFKVELLKKAYELVLKKKLKITDDASAVELICNDVRLVMASPSNIKITTPDDLILASALMRL